MAVVTRRRRRSGRQRRSTMNRKLLWAVFAIGLALVIAPFALGLPGKTAAGQRMMNGFQPIMQPRPGRDDRPLLQRRVRAARHGHADDERAEPRKVPGLPEGLRRHADRRREVRAAARTGAAHDARAGAAADGRRNCRRWRRWCRTCRRCSATSAAYSERCSRTSASSDRCPAGLAHYQPLVTTMQANVDNYKQVNSLPDFRLFTVFFVVPGALLILLAGSGLFGELASRPDQPSTITPGRRQRDPRNRQHR